MLVCYLIMDINKSFNNRLTELHGVCYILNIHSSGEPTCMHLKFSACATTVTGDPEHGVMTCAFSILVCEGK